MQRLGATIDLASIAEREELGDRVCHAMIRENLPGTSYRLFAIVDRVSEARRIAEQQRA